MKQLHRVLFFLFCSSPFALLASTPEESEEAILLGRRVLQLWNSGKYSFAKIEANRFLEKYPSHPLKEKLLILQGKIALKEGFYQEALSNFQKVEDKESVKDLKRLCYKALGNYTALYNSFNKPPVSAQEKLFYAQSLFFSPKVTQKLGKKIAFKRAKSILYSLKKDPKWRFEALFTLTSMQEKLGNKARASKELILLGEKFPKKQSLCFYHAASLIEQKDPSQALSLYQKVADKKEPIAQEAALKEAFLLLQEKNFSMFEQRKKLLSSLLKEKYPGYKHFLFGSFFFLQKQAKLAYSELSKVCNYQDLPKEKKTQSLRMAILSAFTLKDLAKFSNILRLIENNFPKDTALLAKSIFFYAKVLKSPAPEKALKAFQHVQKIALKSKESLASDLEILSLYLQENPSLAKEKLLSILDTPKHPFAKQALQGFLQDSFSRLRTAKTFSQEEDSLQDIEFALSKEDFFSSESYQENVLLLAKTLHHLKRYSSSSHVSKSLMQSFPRSPLLYKAHLQCALNEKALKGEESPSYTFHLEKALEILPPSDKKAESLHLLLFNHYLALGEKEGVSEQTSLAAKHLFSLFKSNPSVIKKNNLTWLANFYFKKVQNFLKEDWRHQLGSSLLITQAERAQEIFSHLLYPFLSEEASPNQDTAPFVLQLSQLYLWQNKPKEALKLLHHSLSSFKEELPFISSMHLYLGQAYEEMEKEKLASSHYQKALLSERGSSPIYVKALFKKAKLELKKSPQDTTLKDLQELQNRKTPETEPIHIEAALLRSEELQKLSSNSNTKASLLTSLKEVRSDYEDQNTIANRRYHDLLKRNPKKERIVQAYLLYIDAKIQEMEAQLAEDEGDLYGASLKRATADTLYQTLQKEKFNLSSFLNEKVQKKQLAQK